ncbi:RrF2 family transcriptional regulator [Rhodovibrionaceae bacterium A322]
MRLTRYSDYSLRLLIYLGIKSPELSTIKEVARHYDISENHLMKVAHKLVQNGLVASVRGRNGGLHLTLPVESITLGRVVRLTEEDMALVECFTAENNDCRISPDCRLGGIFNEALDAFMAVLDRYTLADLLCNSLVLAQLLDVPLPQEKLMSLPNQPIPAREH